MRLALQWAILSILLGTSIEAASKCRPMFVRWPRVKLNVPARMNGPFALTHCRDSCARDENPHKKGIDLQCSAFNHRVGPSDYANECHIFEQQSVQRTDGLIEADDRYSFYWKYCLKRWRPRLYEITAEKSCLGDYGFTFLSDRYIDVQQINRSTHFDSLEDCLSECLNEDQFHCRSVTYNRTSGACSLSEYNQLSKPSMIRINNNPNFRIDYYENNCFKTSDTFHFDYKCEEDGIRVSVKSQFPYTGALYGLYDFFTCRIEPREATRFDYLFPYPTHSKNCSDSIRYKGNEMILEVVLSTDGVEPLYFITADDLTYQARCPIDVRGRQKSAEHKLTTTQSTTTTSELMNHVQLHSDGEKEGSYLARSQKIRMEEDSKERHTGTSRKPKSLEAFTIPENEEDRSTTKDIFPLPLFTTTTTGSPATTQPSTSAAIATWVASEGSRIETQPQTTTTTSTTSTTKKKATTSAPAMESIAPDSVVESRAETVSKNTRPDSFNFTTRISFPTGDKINVITGPSKNQSNKPVSHSEASTTNKPSTTTSTSTVSTTTQSTTPAPFTLFPPMSFPTFPTLAITLAPTTSSTTTTTPTSTTSTTTTTTRTSEPTPPAPQKTNKNESEPQPPGTRSGRPNEAVNFDIFHNGQTTDAVVVGSRITLSFTPYFAIPPAYMSISGCQVEPIDPLYDWEREPLAIIKDGCQITDHVGLVCPPQRTDYGISVTVESFRYQTTTQVQYTCLVRVCSFSPCPTNTCPSVEGCAGDDLLSRTLGLRSKRYVSLDQIRAAFSANPQLEKQLALGASAPGSQLTLQQQLINIGGEHVVRKRLVVVNTDEELHYFVKTGELPEHHN
ncbi:hypothetical protein M3Y94_00236400 [Aphelenchoides besseyi]|nr:hypothetical protein M3Y94_00236400 [Aphelenchoides besseyi]